MTEEVLLEILAKVGVISTIIALWLAVLGKIAALATNWRIVVEKENSSL